MPYPHPFAYFPFGDWLDTLLPDFVLAFAFFTSLSYAVLGRRFGQQRPAVVMSVAIGLALAIGLAWWEFFNDFSIKDLGPVAVGFAVIMLALAMYQAVQRVGGSWSGGAVALGATLVVAGLLGADSLVKAAILRTIAVLALVAGIAMFIAHRQTEPRIVTGTPREPAAVRHDMSDLYRDRASARRISGRLARLYDDARALPARPDRAGGIMRQIRRVLPEQGCLTRRLADLRARAFAMRAGHAARIQELQAIIRELPPEQRRRISEELVRRYEELKLDTRIERLDAAVAEIERRVRALTAQAGTLLVAQDHRGLVTVLEEANRLQQHNARLLRIIQRTEARLLTLAKEAAALQRGE